MSEIQPESELFSVLKGRNPSLASQFELLKKKCLEDWANMLGPDMGSFSGYPHFRNVERNVNQIIPDKTKEDLSTGEIFLLLSSIYLHDIGKTFTVSLSEDFQCQFASKCNEKEIVNNAKCQQFLQEHFVLSDKYISENGAALGLPDEKIAEYCGLLAFCHGLDNPPHKENKKIPQSNCHLFEKKQKNFRVTSISPYGILRIPLLAAILRIADESDNSWMRTYRKELLPINFTNEKEKERYIKTFRRCIEGIEFNHEGHCVIVHVPESDFLFDDKNTGGKFISAIDRAKATLVDVIGSWAKVLEQIDIKLSGVYIEYSNHILQNLSEITNKDGFPCLSMTINTKAPQIKKLFDAIVSLSLGSYDYEKFSWEALEAQVGDPLHDIDRWLVKKISDVSDGLILLDHDDSIIVSPLRKSLPDLRKKIFIDED
jgi:hypothetical protein